MHDVNLSGEPGENQSDNPPKPGNTWADRVRALKNVTPVLRFVWESGPSIVFSNITIRMIVVFLPVGIGIIGRFIIDGVNRIWVHPALPHHFRWLVVAEMALAVITGILSHAIDYFDNLPADRYTHHVSVEVMRKAASLDLVSKIGSASRQALTFEAVYLLSFCHEEAAETVD
jgi:ATP-binding cassette subfamily B protein